MRKKINYISFTGGDHPKLGLIIGKLLNKIQNEVGLNNRHKQDCKVCADTVAVYVVHRVLQQTQVSIAEYFGYKCHTGVTNNISAVKWGLEDGNPIFIKLYNRVLQLLIETIHEEFKEERLSLYIAPVVEKKVIKKYKFRARPIEEKKEIENGFRRAFTKYDNVQYVY
jgi:hypothetical protein